MREIFTFHLQFYVSKGLISFQSALNVVYVSAPYEVQNSLFSNFLMLKLIACLPLKDFFFRKMRLFVLNNINHLHPVIDVCFRLQTKFSRTRKTTFYQLQSVASVLPTTHQCNRHVCPFLLSNC